MAYPWVVLHKDADYAKERKLACSSKIFKNFTKMSIKMHDNNRAHMQTLKLQQLLNQMRILLL
jgi:hypothetical protein